MALTADRSTPRIDGVVFSRPVASGAVIHAGSLVCLSATGFAIAGAVAVGLFADGVAQEAVDNTSGADAALQVTVRRGVYRFANSAGADAITRAEIGDTAYVVDGQTVAKTNGSNARSAAGRIEDVDALGVWVRIG